MKRRGYPKKHSKIIGIIAFAVILSLLGVTIPATPALAQPTVTLSPTSGSIGTRVTITATNFESFKNTEVSIFFNGVEIDNSPVIVPSDGRFTANFDVPEDATLGTAQVVVKTVLGGEVNVSFTVLGAKIELLPNEGHVGTMVTIEGSGFYAEKRVTFYYDGTKTELGSKNASAIGECSIGFAVPESIAGDHQVVAQDTGGGWAEFNFRVIPSITIEPASGAIGDEVTISGTGFGNQSQVTIYLDDEQVATSKTDRYGNLELTFAASITETGTYEVEVKDKDGNRDKAELTLTAGFKLSPTMGNVGTELTISGTGFIGGGTVTVEYDDMEVATTTATASGAFSLTLKVPASTGGIHSITISDGDNTVKNTFNMESTPPPTPAPLIPEDTAKTKAEAYFDWDEVTDDSGVTYTLQIATSKDFSSILLEKKGLTYSDCEITGAEALPPTKKEAYYWRVKAIDGASNESEWSTPRSFYVSSVPALPDWAKYTLIVFVILAVCFLAFWVGRRTAYYRQ